MTTPIPVRSITEAGYTPAAETAGDATNGNSFANNGQIWLEFTNTTGATQTVVVTTPYTVRGNAIENKTYSLPASARLRCGGFDPTVYGDTLVFTVSNVGVTCAAYQRAT